MANWTPQSWVIFFTGLATAIVLVINAFTGNPINVPVIGG